MKKVNLIDHFKEGEELGDLNVQSVRGVLESLAGRNFFIQTPEEIKKSRDISPLLKKIQAIYEKKGFNIRHLTSLPRYGGFCAKDDDGFYMISYSFHKEKKKRDTIKLRESYTALNPAHKYH